MGRAVVKLYPDCELSAREKSRPADPLPALAVCRAWRRNQRGLKRKIERQIECGPGLRLFLPQTRQQTLLLIAVAKPDLQDGQASRLPTATAPPRCLDLSPLLLAASATVGFDLGQLFRCRRHRIRNSSLPGWYRFRRRNLFRGHLCPWPAAQPSPPACNRCSDRRARPSSRPRPAKAGAAILPSRTGCMTCPAGDSPARCSA